MSVNCGTSAPTWAYKPIVDASEDELKEFIAIAEATPNYCAVRVDGERLVKARLELEKRRARTENQVYQR